MSVVQLRVCPGGMPTTDVAREFERVPARGETVRHDGKAYVVVDVDWGEGDVWVPMVIAHSPDRPAARAARGC